jgi:predicted MPP superfamily phosphohydrolase
MWFFLIFFAIYGWGNYYVIRRFLAVLPAFLEPFRTYLLILFIASSIAYIVAKLVLIRYSNSLYDIVLWIGSVWFAVLLYSLLFLIAVDFYRFTRWIVRHLSQGGFTFPLIPASWLFAAWIVIVAGLIVYGYCNAHNIKTKYMSISIPHKTKAGTVLKVMYFSDLHATPVNDGRVIDKLTRISQQEKPDIILMGGDIVDDRSNQLYRIGVDKKFSEFYAPLGMYTCPGNHEYITGKDDTFSFLTKSNVHVLCDSVVTIQDLFQIIGRDDNRKRKPLVELKANTTDGLPVILLDHQPFHLEQAEQAGIDLQLSGHTHHGQMFPFNYITKMVYEVSWGYKEKGNTKYYISSGAGTWGPPIRIGSDSEVILFTITFTEPKN